jgi:glycosyltransferase involved in cell wall biosynthesis
MKLSLIVHANRNRSDRVQTLLTRLTLNKHLAPTTHFEVIVFDGGSNDNTKAICQFMTKALDLKYIYCPLINPTDEAYPLSVATKLATGDVIGFVSADHWISEKLVPMMLEPFEKGYEDVLVGALARSEECRLWESPVTMVDMLLDDRCARKDMEDLLELCKLSTTHSLTPEVWATVPRNLPEVWTYKWQEELGRCGVTNSSKALAIDMWTPPQKFYTVPEKQLGTLDEYGYAEIGGQTLDRNELEEWCEQRS